MSKLKNRPKRKRKGKGDIISQCFKGGGKRCGKVKRKVITIKNKLKKNIGDNKKKRENRQWLRKVEKNGGLAELNKKIKKANANKVKKQEQEAAAKKKKQQAAKKVKIPRLKIKKPKPIPVKTKERTIVKRKPPVKKVVKKKTPVKKVVYKGNGSKVKSTPTKKVVSTKGTIRKKKTVTPKVREPYKGKTGPDVWIKKQGWEVNQDTFKKAMDSLKKWDAAQRKKEAQKKRCGPKSCR